VNENNKPVSGLFTWTALTRRDKLKVLKNLPTYLPELLPSPDATKIALLWKVYIIYIQYYTVNDIQE
jgi:hypothetical protein